MTPFRTQFAEDIFHYKYAHEGCETWDLLSKTLINDVCQDWLSREDKAELINLHSQMKFIAGGRYLYYAGRKKRFYNNCFLLSAEEDTREDWADLSWKSENCLLTGGGIGINYSIYRPKNTPLSATGGVASGPISKMKMINEIGRFVQQGGARRSAIFGSLNWQHADAIELMHAKDWDQMVVPNAYFLDNGPVTIASLKAKDFNFHAPLDMTNISLNYDNDFLTQLRTSSNLPNTFMQNVRQSMKTGEPGMSFNFNNKSDETLRNAPVSADTRVLTINGYKKVRKLVGNPTTIWTGKNWAEGVVFSKTASDVRTIEVHMTGRRVIKADPTHEFFIERWNGKGKGRKLTSIDKISVANLKVGDILHVSLPTSVQVEFDPRSYTLGYIYGDGSFTKKYSNRAEVSLCNDESKDCLEFLDDDLILSVTEDDSRGYTRVYLKNNVFVDRNKKEYPFMAIEEIPSFLAGLFDADGCYSQKQNRIRLSSIHKEFLDGARLDLEQIGILSGITKAGISTYGNKQGWSLVIMGSYMDEFTRLVPTQRLTRDVNGFKPYRQSTIRVKDLRHGPIEDVYCCDVQLDEHSFQAEGVIISNCTEVTSADDSDVCNLASINMSRFDNIQDFRDAVSLATKFLICGTLRGDLPYKKVYHVRTKNRRLGLGLMGVHEWLLQRNYKYEVVAELREWLHVYEYSSDRTARSFSDDLGISTPIARRAIAPTGTIGIMACTSTGIEPLFATAYKRRYLTTGNSWHFQLVVDGTAKHLIEKYNIRADEIETALDLAADPERRIKFQADVQDYVDMGISSTINLPPWGTPLNNEDKVEEFAAVIARYAHRLRGLTTYPDGARNGQPLTPVPYDVALQHEGEEFEEKFLDVCEYTGSSSCES